MFKVPDRTQFEKHGSLPAMDYAAVLVFVVGAMREAKAEFRHLGGDEANDRGTQVITACQAAIAGLMNAATAVKPAEKLQEVRAYYLDSLVEAATNTKWLARLEQVGTGGSNRVLTQGAHAPLLGLVEDWGGSAARDRINDGYDQA
jgi:hypothetical protein